jgi:hypothetical protein
MGLQKQTDNNLDVNVSTSWPNCHLQVWTDLRHTIRIGDCPAGVSLLVNGSGVGAPKVGPRLVIKLNILINVAEKGKRR